MATKPLLKQFGELKLDDFENHPIWVNCHTVDYNESWFDETNEETFRPWAKETPVDPKDAMFLVKASFTFADGTFLKGFVTPVDKRDKGLVEILGMVQPYIFGPKGQTIPFWFGGIPYSEENIKNLYFLLGKTQADVFPIKFEAESGLVKGVTFGVIPGFCYQKNGKISVKR